jgi:hypothetical protein
MEIHPREHPILTLKEFLVHIGTVTIGILIALSLEGLLEWNHHRHLVHEARENIRAELVDNQRELANHLKLTLKNREGQENVLKWIHDVQRDHKSPIHSLEIGFHRAELNNTSWSTAQAVGALSLMDYKEVKKNAAVYELQDEFLRLQTRAEDAEIGAMTYFTGRSDPEASSKEELADEENRIVGSLTALAVQDQMAKQLIQRYSDWLKNENP